jgi:hypothetical protein
MIHIKTNDQIGDKSVDKLEVFDADTLILTVTKTGDAKPVVIVAEEIKLPAALPVAEIRKKFQTSESVETK